jgi:flavorubredoxin
VSAFLSYLTGLKPKGKLWAFFGSYGWGGGAARQMIETAKKAGFDVYEPALEIKYVPTKDELDKCFNFGREIADKIKV